MLIFEHFHLLTKFFHLTGHAPISSSDPKLQSKHQLVSIAISSFVTISLAMFLIFVPHLSSYGLIHNVIRLSSVITGLFVILLANCDCWRYKNVFQRLVHRIDHIEKFLNLSLSLNENELTSNSYKTYRNKVLIIFSLFFISQSLVYTEVWLANGTHNLLSSFFTSLLRLTHPISVAHFMLYNDTVTIFLQNLNQQTRSSPAFFNSKIQVKFLKNIKIMHLELWKLVRKINIYFGWNLLFVIIHSFIYIQVQLYWIFLNLQVKFSLLGIIGK